MHTLARSLAWIVHYLVDELKHTDPSCCDCCNTRVLVDTEVAAQLINGGSLLHDVAKGPCDGWCGWLLRCCSPPKVSIIHRAVAELQVDPHSTTKYRSTRYEERSHLPDKLEVEANVEKL